MLFVIATTAVVLTALFILSWMSWRKNESSLNIKGRCVLITGCDSGIGREAAVQLDKMGACVFATCLTKEGEQSLKSVTSDRMKTFQLDVTNSKQIGVVFEEVNALLDNKAGLWGLVNNAGILTIGPAEWVPLTDYKRTADVNLWGLIDVTQIFLPLVKKAKGRVVCIGSIAGVVSPQAFSSYCITKYGVEAFADSLRREMRQFDVQVSIIEPGATPTPIVNEEVLAGYLKKLWDNLPLEKQKEYGEEYFKTVTKGFQDWGKNASGQVSHVIDAVVHPLTSQSPKSRYVVGRDAWQLKLSAHLPEALQDLLVRDFPFKVVRSRNQDEPDVSYMNGSAS